MYDLPVMLNVRDRRCVIVGGGSVATRRAASLLESGAHVTVVAPRVNESLAAMAVACMRRRYRSSDLEGVFLVVVATDDPAVNAAAAADAATAGVLVNRSDDPGTGDVTISAHGRHGPLTLSVHTTGASAAAAGLIRRELSAALDEDWIRLLILVAPYRARIRDAVPAGEARRDRFRRMVGPEAMATLKQEGDLALQAFCQQLCEA